MILINLVCYMPEQERIFKLTTNYTIQNNSKISVSKCHSTYQSLDTVFYKTSLLLTAGVFKNSLVPLYIPGRTKR